MQQTRKAKRDADAAREEATELGQRLAGREKRTAELEARAEEAARAVEGHRSELAGALAAAKAREGEARQKAEAAEKRMAQVLTYHELWPHKKHNHSLERKALCLHAAIVHNA